MGDNKKETSENIFCDIIAQQQEFQLRQDQRANANAANSLTGIRARTRQLELERQLAEERLWRQDSSERIDFNQLERKQQHEQRPNSSNSHSSKATGEQQPAHNRRKFSLSYAMSSLTAFTTTALSTSDKQQAANSATSNAASNSKQTAPRLEHQASMISGADLSAARSRLLTSYNLHLKQQQQQQAKLSSDNQAICMNPASSARATPTRLEQANNATMTTQNQDQEQQQQQRCQSAESKKRGFVHKAIRRGSKMFDSMLLQSAQRQSEQREHEPDKSTAPQEPDTSSKIDSEPATSEPAHRAVQFAPGEDLAGDLGDRAPPGGRWRKRKLTLGSLPSDLRRALSFNTTSSQQHVKQQQQHQDSLNNQAKPGLKKQDLQADNGDLQRPRKDSLAGESCQAPKVNFKRKNSLFSALSSVNPAQLVKSRSSAERQHQVNQNNQASEQRDRDKFELQRARLASSQNVSLSLCLDHSRTYKLIIYGSGAVGKTSLIQRFLYGHFPAAHKPTVEELHSNKYNIPEVGEIYLEILDTSGTFEFPAMRRLSIEKGDAFILVFSALDAASWQEVIHLRQMILEHKGESQVSRSNADNANNKMASATLSAQASGKAALIGGRQTPSSRLSQRQASGSNESSSNDEHQRPISSVYAAATKLTSMQRRASCVSGSLFSQGGHALRANQVQHQQQQLRSQQQAGAAAAARRRLSVCTTTTTTTNDPSDCHNNNNNNLGCSPSSAHYNSQLSRLIQLAPVCDTSSKLLESGNSLDEQQPINGDGGDCEESANESESDGINQNSCTDNYNRDRMGALKKTNNDSALHNNNQTSGNLNNKRNVSMAPQKHTTTSDGLGKLAFATDLGIFKRTTTPIVVAANKCDCSPAEWQVDLAEAERLVCNEWGHSFVRCSAKEAQNTDRVFRELLRQAQAPANLSESVIDDNQLRRQSLPVLKNQLSVSQMKGLRNLYNMHTAQHGSNNNNNSATSQQQANYCQAAKLSSSKQQYQNNHQMSHQSSSDSSSQATGAGTGTSYARSGADVMAQSTPSAEPAPSRAGQLSARSASSASDDSQCIIS